MKIKIMFVLIIMLILTLFCYEILIHMNNNDLVVSANELSNKKVEWGIKRVENHQQPDLGKARLDTLSQNNGIAIGNKDSKKIYLTFDEGYEAGYTNKILEVLKENNVNATFFITAHYLNTQPELVKQMIDEGHVIGNHTSKHKSMPSLTEEQIEEEILSLHQAVYEKFNYEMKHLRPPMGEFSEKSLAVTNNLGYQTVMWSFAYKDWEEQNQPDEEKAIKIITENFHSGEIMLLHANSSTNTNILPEIIKQAREQGYIFESLNNFEE